MYGTSHATLIATLSILYMSKGHIAAMLFRMKKHGEEIARDEGELVSADELLTRYYGREVMPDEAQSFIRS